MEVKPYKIKCEIIFIPDSKSTGIRADYLYVCDPEKNTECVKSSCGKDCTMTRKLDCAKHIELTE